MEQNSLFSEYKGAFEQEEESKIKSAKKGAKHGFDFFALPDSVGRKSTKDMWLEYVRSSIKGAEPEMLHAGIVGKVRDMLLSQKATAEDLDMHPFVYKKAKADFKNWNKVELQNFYDKLVFIYHDARISGTDLALEIEKALLAIGTNTDKPRAAKMI